MSDGLLAYWSHEEKISSVRIMRHGNILKVAVGTFIGEVILWKLCINDMEKLCDVDTIARNELTKHGDEVTAVHFNLSQTKLVSCSLDGLLHVCDVDTGMLLFRKQQDSPMICMNWSYSDEYLFLGDESGTLSIWNMTTGEVHYKLVVFDGFIACMDTSVCDKRIVVAGYDSGINSMKILKCLP